MTIKVIVRAFTSVGSIEQNTETFTFTHISDKSYSKKYKLTLQKYQIYTVLYEKSNTK